ncbi:hypothetical protein K2173_005165 [Erythroxylum novogranatense]|uniref:Translation initiation factor IF2/IF5 domain-containing protein n=1 Tax=Erythroxylum novogranatense TaxID=1862640 RepID=A0AAV8TRN6_9ROSI|nr:hypothetical protein K2173_005165 [Erythroxylum novogranatense]
MFVENASDISKDHRQPDHVMAFLLAELGTSRSFDGQQRLVVKGRFAPKNFEGTLRRYITWLRTIGYSNQRWLCCSYWS